MTPFLHLLARIAAACHHAPAPPPPLRPRHHHHRREPRRRPTRSFRPAPTPVVATGRSGHVLSPETGCALLICWCCARAFESDTAKFKDMAIAPSQRTRVPAKRRLSFGKTWLAVGVDSACWIRSLGSHGTAKQSPASCTLKFHQAATPLAACPLGERLLAVATALQEAEVALPLSLQSCRCEGLLQ